MIYLPTCRMLLLHVPRTGGTALKQAIRSAGLLSIESPLQYKHAGLPTARKIFGPLVDGARTICVIRDPIEQVLSSYLNVHRCTASPALRLADPHFWRHVRDVHRMTFVDYVALQESDIPRGGWSVVMRGAQRIPYDHGGRYWQTISEALHVSLPITRANQHGQPSDDYLTGELAVRIRDHFCDDQTFVERARAPAAVR